MVWLYAGLAEKLSVKASASIEGNALLISPVVRLELRFLLETGRIDVSPSKILGALESEIGLSTCNLPFIRVVQQAELIHWTRDPFDRIIVGHAKAGGLALLTRDETIRRHFSKAIW